MLTKKKTNRLLCSWNESSELNLSNLNLDYIKEGWIESSVYPRHVSQTFESLSFYCTKLKLFQVYFEKGGSKENEIGLKLKQVIDFTMGCIFIGCHAGNVIV